MRSNPSVNRSPSLPIERLLALLGYIDFLSIAVIAVTATAPDMGLDPADPPYASAIFSMTWRETEKAEAGLWPDVSAPWLRQGLGSVGSGTSVGAEGVWRWIESCKPFRPLAHVLPAQAATHSIAIET